MNDILRNNHCFKFIVMNNDQTIENTFKTHLSRFPTYGENVFYPEFYFSFLCMFRDTYVYYVEFF